MPKVLEENGTKRKLGWDAGRLSGGWGGAVLCSGGGGRLPGGQQQEGTGGLAPWARSHAERISALLLVGISRRSFGTKSSDHWYTMMGDIRDLCVPV